MTIRLKVAHKKECQPIPETTTQEMRKLANEALNFLERESGRDIAYLMPTQEKRITPLEYWKDRAKDHYYKDIVKLTGNSLVRKAASLMQSGWFNGPCTSNGVALQEATTCAFKGERKHGCKKVDYQPIKGSPETQMLAATAEAVFTQETLKRTFKKDSIGLYRGIVDFPADACVELPVRPLSSWTTNKKWAKEIALMRARDVVVVKKEIPISRIVAWSPVAEYLSGLELEAIVLAENGTEKICPENIEVEHADYLHHEPIG